MGMAGIFLLAAPGRSQQQEAPKPPSSGASAKDYVEFGMANGAKGDLNGAIEAFNEAITIDPKYAPAYYNLGIAYSVESRTDDAISEYSQAIQLDAKNKDAYYRRGCLRGKKGDLDGALGDFDEVIKLDPKYALAYYNRGHVFYFKGNLDGAVNDLDEALRLDPNSSLCHYIRGLIWHAQEHREEALADFQKSSGLNFPYAAFWNWITETEMGRRGAAAEDLLNALKSPAMFKPGDWPSQIGNFLLDKITENQLMLQAKAGTEAESQKRLCQAWFYSGILKHFTGDNKGAQDCFLKAIATGSTSSEEFVEANRAVAELQK
jgi:lipoprotein NlpI